MMFSVDSFCNIHTGRYVCCLHKCVVRKPFFVEITFAIASIISIISGISNSVLGITCVFSIFMTSKIRVYSVKRSFRIVLVQDSCKFKKECRVFSNCQDVVCF